MLFSTREYTLWMDLWRIYSFIIKIPWWTFTICSSSIESERLKNRSESTKCGDIFNISNISVKICLENNKNNKKYITYDGMIVSQIWHTNWQCSYSNLFHTDIFNKNNTVQYHSQSLQFSILGNSIREFFSSQNFMKYFLSKDF